MTAPQAEPPTLLNITDVVSGPIPPRVMNLSLPNMLHTRIPEIVARKGPPPWSVRVIADERNLVTLIANGPGTGNRPHWHKDFDEWWVILAGRLRWELTGGTVIEAVKDDIVLDPPRHGSSHHECGRRAVVAIGHRDAARGALLQRLRAVRLYRRRATRILVGVHPACQEPPSIRP
ncbi:MAG: hypothetical protein JO318_07215 [Chloroflexi bacterium]|nr:hypothetical protein [Chloroflexota bacterium]